MDPRVKTVVLDREGMPLLPQTDATAMAEENFERTAIRILEKLYPSCDVFPYKPSIRYNGEGWRPDLAMVDKRKEYWFLIEVETVNHSFEKHVRPQVTAFQYGEHTDESVQRLSERLHIDVQQARTMISHIPQYVAVILNADNLDWEKKLDADGVQFMSITTFQDVSYTTAHYVTGSLKASQRSKGFGTFLAAWPAIRMSRPEMWTEPVYRITDATGTSYWDCQIHEGYAFLSKKRGVLKLQDRSYVQLIAQDDGTLFLKTML